MTETQIDALRQIAAHDGRVPSWRLTELQIQACAQAGLVLRTRHGIQLTFKGRNAVAAAMTQDEAA
jgi:hypothetical protein